MNWQDEPVVVVVPGDLHLTEPDLDNVGVTQWVVREVNDLIRPDFVQFIGDNVQDATEAQFELFNNIRSDLNVLQFALVGDHDVKNDPSAKGFRRHVGEPFGALSLHGFRFIRLNTQEMRPLGMLPDQVDWFRRQVVDAVGQGERIVVFQHNYPYQVWENFDGPGIDEWRAIVQSHRVEAIICGHTHYWQVANDGRNIAIATRSIGDPEGGPPGYTLVYLRGADLAVTYRSVDDQGPLVLVTHPRERLLATAPSHVVRGSDQVIVRVWSEVGVLTVRCRVDEGPWSELKPLEDGHWTGPLQGNHLPKGEHDLEVVATSSEGLDSYQKIQFMVDPTGRYTAVPESRPVVMSTAFC